jgi:uncharacterized protein (TIGR00251 family)
MPAWYRREPDGSLTVCVHAQPGARRSEVSGLHGDALKVRVAARAVDGRANAALVALLAAAFDVPARNVSLLSGEKSREKRVRIVGSAIDPEKLSGSA